jgi:hypothetical protein
MSASEFETRTWYHGSSGPVATIYPGRRGADGELLCLSASVNVARRYGATVSQFSLPRDSLTIRYALADWMTNRAPTIDQLRDEGYHAVIIEAGTDSFDFPVETLFVLSPDAVEYSGTLSPESIARLDDSLPVTSEPAPGQPGWREYVGSIYGGDESAALADLEP